MVPFPKDGATQKLFCKNLNVVMVDNGVPNTNFMGFMVDNIQANWTAMRKIYGDGDLSLLIIGDEDTCLSIGLPTWIR